MKKIAIWAARNPGLSRMLIVLFHLLAITCAVAMGLLMFFFEWNSAYWPVVVIASIVVLLYLSYPSVNKGTAAYLGSFRRRKLYDFSFVALYSGAIAFSLSSFLAQPEQFPCSA